MASRDANLLALLLAPGFVRLAPYVALPKLHAFSHYRACQCIGSNNTDGEGVERPGYGDLACFEHGELAPRFDWAFQYPLDAYEDGALHIDEDDDEMPGLMSQDESDSFKTNRVHGFKPRNLSEFLHANIAAPPISYLDTLPRFFK
ncbi:hypothetical protein B0H11DRAFT_2266481 [Mycena galericulata]|nr:hypothetical protein B0H11DRAFT_2266481 [Mycena galericulata]